VENKEYMVSRKTLPRNKKRYHLYEAVVEEEDYLKSKISSKMYSFLCDKNIEGIYETKIPLAYKAILQLNAKVKPKKEYQVEQS